MPTEDRQTRPTGQAGREEGPRETGKRKRDHPPPAEGAHGPLTPLKIRAIFFDKPFPMQLNLAKSRFWSRKSRGLAKTQSRKC